MRSAGLDAAALTDHAGFADPEAIERVREVVPWAGMPVKIIRSADFVRAGELADAADDPGALHRGPRLRVDDPAPGPRQRLVLPGLDPGRRPRRASRACTSG